MNKKKLESVATGPVTGSCGDEIGYKMTAKAIAQLFLKNSNPSESTLNAIGAKYKMSPRDVKSIVSSLSKSKAAVDHLKKEGLHKEGDTMEVDPKELKLGIKIEMEHTSSKGVAREIALDHLHEDSKYYTHLIEMENENVNKSLLEGDMKTRFALILVPGEIEPLEKADHPASLSNVSGKTKSKIPYEGHAERMKFAKMAAERMIGSSKPEDEGKYADTKRVDGKGRVKGAKAPHKNYNASASGSGSRAHDNFGRRTIIVKPEEIGSSKPESTTKHTPVKNVKKPRS